MRSFSASQDARAPERERAWLSTFSGVAYSAAKYTNNSLVFQLNTDVRSASIEKAKYACVACAQGPRRRQLR